MKEKGLFCGRHRKRLIKKMNLSLLFFPFLTRSKYWCESSHEKKKMQQKEEGKAKSWSWKNKVSSVKRNRGWKNEQLKARQMTGTRDTHTDKLHTASIGLKRLPNALLPRDSFHDSVDWWKEGDEGIFVSETDSYILCYQQFSSWVKKEKCIDERTRRIEKQKDKKKKGLSWEDEWMMLCSLVSLWHPQHSFLSVFLSSSILPVYWCVLSSSSSPSYSFLYCPYIYHLLNGVNWHEEKEPETQGSERDEGRKWTKEVMMK